MIVAGQIHVFIVGLGDEALANHRGKGYAIYVADHAQDISQHLQPLGGVIYMGLGGV